MSVPSIAFSQAGNVRVALERKQNFVRFAPHKWAVNADWQDPEFHCAKCKVQIAFAQVPDFRHSLKQTNTELLRINSAITGLCSLFVISLISRKRMMISISFHVCH